MTAVKTKSPIKPVDEIRGALVKMEQSFKMALPPQITVEKFMRVVQTAIQTSLDLQSAERSSLYAACMKSAQDGLLPDGKEAALIPYSGKVTYVPMVYGILKKVRNSGELASLSPHVVYEKDEFQYWVDEKGEHFVHRPALGDRGHAVRAYAAAMTKDGFLYFEVMTAEEIEKIRSNAKAKNGPAWTHHWGEMARKTVIRRLSKRLPMSSDLESSIYADDELYDGPSKDDAKEEKDVSPVTKPAARLNSIIDEKLAPPEIEQVDDNSEEFN